MSPSLQSYFREARGTVALAIPIIIGQVSQVLMGITDSVMIGHIPGEEGTIAFAASSFAGNIFMFFFVLIIGLLLSVPTLVARAHGEGKPQECAEYMRHGMALGMIVALVELVVLLVLSMQLEIFRQPPEVVAATGTYFRIIAFSIVPVSMFQVQRQYSEAMGHPWAPMTILLGCVGLNVVLNWVLIFGHWGMPALGLTGAGIATLVSRIVAVLWLFAWLRRDPIVRAAWPVRWFVRVSKERLMAMLRIGLPASGQLLFESSAFAFSAVMMGWFDSAIPIGAHQVTISCASFSFMFVLGLGAAAGIRIGQVMGTGEHARLRPIGFGALYLCIGWMACAGLVMSFGRYIIVSFFGQGPAVTELAVKLLIVAAVFQVFDGMQVVGSGILRGMTDVKVPTALTFVAYWVIALPTGYFFGVKGSGGPVGVWVALAFGLAFAGIALASRFARLTRPQL